jgi:flagellin
MSNMSINTNTQAQGINRIYKNDPARTAAGEKIRAQIRGLDIAGRNAQDGSSMARTADNGARQIENLIQRARDLTVRSANDTNSASDRQKAAQEISQLFEEADRLAGRTEFNGKKLLDGSLSAPEAIYLQVGPNEEQNMTFGIAKSDLDGLGLKSLRDAIKTAATAELNGSAALAANTWLSSGVTVASALGDFDEALEIISRVRSSLGTIENRLESIMINLDISSENTSATSSRITDTDMAKEMMSMTKTGILQKSAVAMLTHSYQNRNRLVSLLADHN